MRCSRRHRLQDPHQVLDRVCHLNCYCHTLIVPTGTDTISTPPQHVDNHTPPPHPVETMPFTDRGPCTVCGLLSYRSCPPRSRVWPPRLRSVPAAATRRNSDVGAHRLRLS